MTTTKGILECHPVKVTFSEFRKFRGSLTPDSESPEEMHVC